MENLKVFRAIPDLCTGCLECEIVCSLKKTGRVNVAYARMKVRRSRENGQCKLVICRHCKAAPCEAACPVPEAMYRDERTGAIVIRDEHCTGCLACVDACPFGAIQVGPNGEVLKCDLCGGSPVCVEYCYPRPARQFPGLPYPSASCLEYVEPHKTTRKEIVD